MRYAFLSAIALVALGAQPANPQAPAVVNVQLSSFKFAPRTIVLNRSGSYVLRLHNVSKDSHDFSAPSFFSASTIAPADRAMVVEGSVEVRPGTIREIGLTAPAAAGRYKLKCTHTFHKMFGMSGTIIVR